VATSYDILLDTNGDLPIETNDLQLGPSDNQHIQDCIYSAPGWWKQFPDSGVGIMAYQKARLQQQTLLNKTKGQLEKDGYTVINPKATISNGILQIVLSDKNTNTFIYKE